MKKSILILILISWLQVRYQDIKISTSKQQRYQVGIFFSQNKKWTFHEIQYSLYGLYHLFNCPNLFPKFHVIEMNSFSKTKKSFFWNNTKIFVFPHICLKTSTFTDNRVENVSSKSNGHLSLSIVSCLCEAFIEVILKKDVFIRLYQQVLVD